MGHTDEGKWKRVVASVKAGDKGGKQPKNIASKTARYR